MPSCSCGSIIVPTCSITRALWRWGIGFIANCTPDRFRRNSLTNLKLALHSLKILQQIRAETGIEYDLRTVGVLKIYTSAESFKAGLKAAEFMSGHGLTFEPADRAKCLEHEPALKATADSLVGGIYFARDEVGDCHKFTTALAAHCAAQGVKFRYGTEILGLESRSGRIGAVTTSAGTLFADNFVAALASYTPGFARCLEAAAAKQWAGVRPVTPSGTPILDRSPIPNLYIAAGHGHLGWTMGCGSGHITADLVAGRTPKIDMGGFGLSEH